MKIVDKEKEIYQLFLDKGCINYHDFSDEDKKVVLNLIEKSLLCREEIEHSDFIVLIKDKMNEIENIKDFDFYYNDIEIKIKESVRLFRKERNLFLKFIAKEGVAYEKEILNKYDSLIFNKCISYIKYRQIKDINVYHLNPLGYKAIFSEYNSDIIDLAVLRRLNDLVGRVKTDNNSYLEIIKILRKLKTDFYISILDLNEYKKYENYFTKMKYLDLVDFFYGKDYKLIFLTEKGFDIVSDIGKGMDYTVYKEFLNSKVKKEYINTYILYDEQILIKKLIDYNLVKKSELDKTSKNLKEFLSEYIANIEFLDNEYIYLKGQFYAEHNIPNNKSDLLNSALQFLVENNIENIPDLDTASRNEVYKIFAQSRILDKTLDSSLRKSGLYIRKIKDSMKHKTFFNISILIYKGILSLRIVGSKKYIIITKEGCKYFSIPEYSVTEEKIFKNALISDKYEDVLLEIYNQKLVSKTKFEKIYGKSIYLGIKDYVEELDLNGYKYIGLRRSGYGVICKKYIPNKNTLKYTLVNSKKAENIEKIDLDIIDKTILKFIYKHNFVNSTELASLVGSRAKKLLSFGLLNRHCSCRETSVSEKGCFLIEKKHITINADYIKKFSKKIKSAKVYFFKKELATELISILDKEDVTDKNDIFKRCNKVLAFCNDIFDKRNQSYILTKHEENILYTICHYNFCFKETTLNKDIVKKFNKYGVLNICKGGEYFKTNKVCTDVLQRINPEYIKIYPIIESGNDFQYTILNSNLILKRYKDIKVEKKKSTKEKIKGKKQQSVKHYKNDVKYLFNGVNKGNLKKHIDFLRNGKYIIFDTEFSTTKGDKSNMIEISAIKVDKLNIVDEFSYLIRDHEDMLTKSVSRLTKIKRNMLIEDGFGERHVLNKFIEFIEDLPVMAHAVENDWHSCVLLGCDNNNIPLPKNKILDSFLILNLIYPKDKCGLDGLISKFNLRSKEIPRHRALGDSIYTLNVIKKAVESKNKKVKVKPNIESKIEVEISKRNLVDLELVEVV